MTRFGIIGGGLMGHGIAVALAQAGHQVGVFDIDPVVLASLDARVGQALSRIGVPPGQIRTVQERIAPVASLPELARRSEIVVESVSERLAVKHDVLAAIESDIAPDTPIWTNTSVLSISKVAHAMAHPERLVGVHWWNPPYLIPLVEIAPGEESDANVVKHAYDLIASLGKTTVRLHRDVPGFIGNRLQFALVREALYLLDEGVCEPETIDTVVRASLGLRWAAVGPMENADYIGLDLTRAILANLAHDLSTQTNSFPTLDQLLEQARTGRPTGSGLLTWPDGRGDEVATRLEAGIRRGLSPN
ncbi:3-hydroxyacyl-CoA dehydrogenase family protein [Amycolatopsis sp. QT-25]|nr:3-hydroxyacyl-CoA dehydrogenase family protein [Amycolatopsis sp. QT-25]WET79017.1 3-hydroxyacyl-CoA dehydrogenase family protein [Amycolatopsis sp. QT-25]